jgi:hypothetical protein
MTSPSNPLYAAMRTGVCKEQVRWRDAATWRLLGESDLFERCRQTPSSRWLRRPCLLPDRHGFHHVAGPAKGKTVSVYWPPTLKTKLNSFGRKLPKQYQRATEFQSHAEAQTNSCLLFESVFPDNAVCKRPQNCPFVWKAHPTPLCLNAPANTKHTNDEEHWWADLLLSGGRAFSFVV